MFTDLSHWLGEKPSLQNGPKKLVLDPLSFHRARHRSLHFPTFLVLCEGRGGGVSSFSFCHHTGKLGRGITSNLSRLPNGHGHLPGVHLFDHFTLQGSFDIMRRVKNLNPNLSYPMKGYSSRVPVSSVMLVGQQRPHVISKIE